MALQSEHLLSIGKVAERLDVSTKTVRRMWRDGRLPDPVDLGGGLYRWRSSAIDHYLATLERVKADQSGSRPAPGKPGQGGTGRAKSPPTAEDA